MISPESHLLIENIFDIVGTLWLLARLIAVSREPGPYSPLVILTYSITLLYERLDHETSTDNRIACRNLTPQDIIKSRYDTFLP
jgi:hypothetical protein